MTETPSISIQRALERYDLGYPEEAIGLLEKLADAATGAEQTALHLQLAGIYLAIEEFGNATDILSAAKDLSEDVQAQYLLGLGYRHQAKWNQAVEALQRANRLLVDDPAILSSLGIALYQQGDKDKGKDLVIRAVRIDPSRPASLSDMALICTSEGNLPAALACAQREYTMSNGKSTQAARMLRDLMDLQSSLEAQGIPVNPIQKPRTEADWRQVISVAPHPFPVIEQMAEQEHPRSERELQRIAEKVNRLWNTTPRPELGNLAPNEMAKVKPRPSRVEMPPSPPWLNLDQAASEANALRKDMVAFLTHLRDVRYKATAAAGNLPLKAIHAINPLLVKPGPLESSIGDKVYKVRNVGEIWRLELLQALAITGDLAEFEKGKPIVLKEAGTRFVESSPARQIWVLLDAWWWHTNWLITYQWHLFDEFPFQIPRLARALYQRVKPNTWVSIKDFVDDLIELGKLEEAATVHRDPLTHGVERAVIQIMEDFEVVELKRKPKLIGNHTFYDAVSFRLTKLGEQLIQSI